MRGRKVGEQLNRGCIAKLVDWGLSARRDVFGGRSTTREVASSIVSGFAKALA